MQPPRQRSSPAGCHPGDGSGAGPGSDARSPAAQARAPAHAPASCPVRQNRGLVLALGSEEDTTRVLVIDGDDAARSAVRKAMLLGGYEVLTAATGHEGLLKTQNDVTDSIVLDLGLPDIDGMEVCRRLRDLGNRTPILMLTARVEVEDRIDGLDAGADDYLTKPYDVRELQARLKAIMRRHIDDDADEQSLHFPGLKLDADAHAARLGERQVDLTRTEYQLLKLLMLNPRRVLTAELIYDRIWGYDFEPGGNALRVYIGYLRRKLEANGEPRLIQTVRGVGYVLREP
jgi:two-component system, OmpR family, response regulator MprA